MNPQIDKIERVIGKVVDNGFKLPNDYRTVNEFIMEYRLLTEEGQQYALRGILFNKEFARRYWGETNMSKYPIYENGKMYEDDDNRVHRVYELDWEYHIKQAVLSDDPIDYYDKNP